MAHPVQHPTPCFATGHLPQSLRSFDHVLREMTAFYDATGGVHQTLRRLVRRLGDEGIPHAVIGGMALAAHGFVRATEDVDLLVAPEGLQAFRECCVGREYVPAFPGATKSFRDAETRVRIEFITAGEFPGDGKPKAVEFPDPDASTVVVDRVHVLSVDKLIELKLASGLSAPHRLRDLADVQDLIRALGLPEELGESLDPSVRRKYSELWAATQTPSGERSLAEEPPASPVP